MTFRFKAISRCELVRPNNGIIKAVFIPQLDISDHLSQQEIVYINVMKSHGDIEQDRDYLISIVPSFPH